MKPFTIVTAVTDSYLPKLRWSLPTWPMKPQFRGAPLIIYRHGVSEKDLAFARESFPDVRIIEWDFPAESMREKMLSAFLFGAARDVQTEYWAKVDADSPFTTTVDVFDELDFSADVVGPKWSYTKPGWWNDALAAWLRGKEYTGPREPGRGACKRVAGYLMLLKSEFIRNSAKACGARMPVPSFDTLAWFLAENVKGCKLIRKPMKSYGVTFCKTWKGVRERACSGACAWNPAFNCDLISHVQLEITTACNLTCPNCDRACAQAPSKEHMTLEQIRRFVRESLDQGKTWGRVDILGGEPTLHPQYADVWKTLEPLRPWVRRWRLTTNGTSDVVKRRLAETPEWVKVRNSANEKAEPDFSAVNVAPCDQGVTDALACSVPWRCGMALTRYGYFLCGAGAGIARIFRLPIGIKRLSALTPEALRAQRERLCRLCGHSASTTHRTTKQEYSPTWERAVMAYNSDVDAREMELY